MEMKGKRSILPFRQTLVQVPGFRNPADGPVKEGGDILVAVAGHAEVFFDFTALVGKHAINSRTNILSLLL